jgi:peptidoglycan/LPS O-acetylase OafA/YrhL
MLEYKSIKGTIPSLDGIRALSVFLVILSHVGFGHIVPGGFGVTVFFFLSGFLITTLLVKEYAKQGRINVYNFFIRRFLRLMPPVFITLLIAYTCVKYDVLSGGASFEGFFAQLFYFANYYFLYFDASSNTPKGTGILWSLSIEEHFYLLYPLLISLCFIKYRLNFIGGGACIILCVLVLLWRIYLVGQVDFDSVRTYYATDTRIDSILFGCIFALFCNPILSSKKSNDIKLIDYILILISVSILLFTFLYRDEYFRETYRYSLQGIALMPLFYYAVALHKSFLFKWLNSKVVKKVGVLSYSIYLCHFIIYYILIKNINTTLSPYIMF